MQWQVTWLPAICLAVGVIELDDTHVGQWLVSRPFVLGPLVGWASGDFWMGVKMGALVELLTIEDLPVGNAIPVNGSLAVAAAALFAGWDRPVAQELALPAGIGLGWGFRRVEMAIRSGSSRWTSLAERELKRNRAVPFGRIAASSLAWHALVVSTILYATVALLATPLAWAWGGFPEAVRHGLRLAFQAAPWLGTATLMRAFRWRA